MDFSKNDLFLIIEVDSTKFNNTLTESKIELMVSLIILFTLLMLILYFLFNKTITLPINIIMTQIDKISNKDYAKQEVLSCTNELGLISNNLSMLSNIIIGRETDLEHLSTHDGLTGLTNRRYFNTYLEKAINKSERNNEQLGLVFVDLDLFKEINDTMGHDVGDELLRVVAKRLKSILRRSDTISRIGGDEFLILVENTDRVNKLDTLILKIMKSFEEPFNCFEDNISITCSVGISIYPEDGTTPVDLIKHADLALYNSKDTGRSNFSFFSKNLSEKLENKIKLVNALKVGIEKKEFHLMYQPKINMVTGLVDTVEALVRWESSLLGTVYPDQFIPMAEQSGMIMELGEWILEKASIDFMFLINSGLNLKQISVNVSGVQLLNSKMDYTVKKIIDKIGIKSSQIELEITESYIATNQDHALETLYKLRSLGVELAIDDFGTGYSSLSYLMKLPVTRLKVDKSFIDHVPQEKDSIAIVKTVISLAKSLNLHVTAEGVELKSQVDFLKELECDEIQGYYYSKPLVLTDLFEYLKNYDIVK